MVSILCGVCLPYAGSRLRRFRAFVLLVLLVAGSSITAGQVPDKTARSYPYQLWDVFTDLPLTGNQLAVFTATPGLSAELMQQIAREMALSETAFVFPADDPAVTAGLRIFSTSRELSFAGHPTIGTAFALAASGVVKPGTARIQLAESIGPVPVALDWQQNKLRFAWMDQRPPVFGKRIDDLEGMAAGLGVDPALLRAMSLPVQEISCGSPYIMVPLVSRAAVDKAEVDSTPLKRIFDRAGVGHRSMLLFAMEPAAGSATVYSRLLRLDGTEDPATGGASGPLGSYLVNYGLVAPEAATAIVSLQGVKMARPSRIHIRIHSSGNDITAVQVGGSAVHIGDGRLVISQVDGG